MSNPAQPKFRELVRKYKAEAKQKALETRQQRKAQRTFPKEEKAAVRASYKAGIQAWKQDIKNSKGREKRAKRIGFRKYNQILRRPIVITVWAAILVPLCAFVSISLGIAYGKAVKPLSPQAQQAADASRVVAEQVMSESIVLLKNEGNTLPLPVGHPVNVFGSAAAKMNYGGSGAGAVNIYKVTTLFTAFDEQGMNYNRTLYNLYGNYAFYNKPETKDFKPPRQNLAQLLLPNLTGMMTTSPVEMPAEYLTDAIIAEAKAYSDVAIYVVGRQGSEGIDATADSLALSQTEGYIVELLNANFDHVIILLNTCNTMELGWINEYDHIDSVLWVGAPGQYGTYAIAKTLTGEYNPSGRLVDTYAYNVESNPATWNTGNFTYVDAAGADTSRRFVNYLEDIYVGYRYYETFITDEAKYQQTVQFPFGYGLSYTTFEWKTLSHSFDASTISVEVQVTNTGKVSGKDVVQVYFTPPYDPASGLEKSAIVLGAFAKTDLLAPGDSQVLTITFSTDDMASYDDKVNEAWVLEKGEYLIKVARNIHQVEAVFPYQAPETLILKQDNATGAEIQNLFNGVDGGLTYLSRSDPQGTMPTAPEGDDFLIPASVVASEQYIHVPSSEPAPTTGADNGILLSDLKGLAYDDPKWYLFLDQFTAEEMIQLTTNAGFWSVPIERLGIPATRMVDGPAAIRFYFESWSTVAFPIATNVASTWNTDLAEAMGQAMGNEAKAWGVSAVYAPSMNLHRSPLGGRNFEYYSEDPLISGKMAAAYTHGMQGTGVVATLKHFALNEQERNRASRGLYTWATEQSMRELYLKPFELAVKEGGAHGVMSAFNRIGTVWAGGNSALLTDLLRNEWGFKGYVITDMEMSSNGHYFNPQQAIEAGNDMIMVSAFQNDNNNDIKKMVAALQADNAGTLIALRNAVHNICFYILQSYVMK